MGAGGALIAAPMAPFPLRARKIPPKAGVSRVYTKFSLVSRIVYSMIHALYWYTFLRRSFGIFFIQNI